MAIMLKTRVKLKIKRQSETRKDNRSDALESIADAGCSLQQQIKDMQAKLDSLQVRAAKTLRAFGVKEYVSEQGNLVALEATAGRNSSSIDPRLLYDVVTEEEFFNCVKVHLGATKEVLDPMTMESITMVTKGKPGEPKIVFKRSKTK